MTFQYLLLKLLYFKIKLLDILIYVTFLFLSSLYETGDL